MSSSRAQRAREETRNSGSSDSTHENGSSGSSSKRKHPAPTHLHVERIECGTWAWASGAFGFTVPDEVLCKVIYSQKKVVWEWFDQADGQSASKKRAEAPFGAIKRVLVRESSDNERWSSLTIALSEPPSFAIGLQYPNKNPSWKKGTQDFTDSQATACKDWQVFVRYHQRSKLKKICDNLCAHDKRFKPIVKRTNEVAKPSSTVPASAASTLQHHSAPQSSGLTAMPIPAFMTMQTGGAPFVFAAMPAPQSFKRAPEDSDAEPARKRSHTDMVTAPNGQVPRTSKDNPQEVDGKRACDSPPAIVQEHTFILPPQYAEANPSAMHTPPCASPPAEEHLDILLNVSEPVQSDEPAADATRKLAHGQLAPMSPPRSKAKAPRGGNKQNPGPAS